MTILEDAIAALSVAVEDLRIAALRDDKTPLQNALALNVRLKDLLAEGKEYVVVFGDINGFKAINSEHTYRGGDVAINRVGTVIAETLRPFHGVTAYRQSGDEFTIIAPRDLVSRVSAALGRHLGAVDVSYERLVNKKSENRLFTVGLSFGWAVADADTDAHTWQSRAEDACKVAKARGVGTVVEWTAELNAEYDEERCRCNQCGCECAVKAERGKITSVSVLHCPVCGKQQTLA